MPAGAVSPAQPVTELMVAKAQPRPDRRRLSSGLSAAYQSDGRRGVSLDIESMVTPVFATLIFDDIIGLLKSIRRLNRATMSSAPDEPQKNYTASDEPFRYTGSSTGRSAVCIINDQYSQNQIIDCLNNLLL